MPAVAIVVLNFNGKKHLRDFLPTLTRLSPYPIIVADNHSADDSVLFLEQNFPQVRVLKLKENHGFAGGYNEALKKVHSDYYILINSDVEVTKGWCEPLIGFLENNRHYACCQPKIKSFDQKNHFEYAGAAGGFIDRLGYPFCRGRIFDIYEKDYGQYDEPIDVFWTSGACMAIKAELFDDVGGFDADLFAHMEEIDLCWRIQKRGYGMCCLPQQVVYHVGGGTLSRSNPKKTYLNFRNNLMVLTKNLPVYQLIWKLPFRIVLDVIAAFVFWRYRSFAHFRSVIGAIRDFLLSFSGTWAKRNHDPASIYPVPLSNVSVVWQHFILRKRYFHWLHVKVSNTKVRCVFF